MWSPYNKLSNRYPKKVTKGQGQGMLSWLPLKLPGCQFSTLVKNKLQTFPRHNQTRNVVS